MNADPISALASSLHARPGAYALLLGSGISRSAGVMTGWEIATDLVRRLALLEGQDVGADPIAWYSTQRGDDLDYSKLLEHLAPSPGDRQALLDPYFAVTEADTEQGLKQPTQAHRAIASLVRSGRVKVIITTNFDRLMERALQDVGIDPLVVSSARDAKVAPPLHSLRCLIIKVHGDHASPDLRNTLAELAAYDEALQSFLERILDEHGLIVCGWSADWDSALRNLVSERQSPLFATFWTHRGPPSALAQQLIKGRVAHPVAIDDADSFFVDLASRIAALDELAAGTPDSAEVRLAELKRFLPDPIHRIRLQDLVMSEVERMLRATDSDSLPVDSAVDPVSYLQRLAVIEAVVLPGAELLANLAFLADEERHDQLIERALLRLARRQAQQTGSNWLIPLQWYPALLATFAVGIAALAAERPDPFLRVLARGRIEELGRDEPLAFAQKVYPGGIVQIDVLKTSEEFARHHTPASDLLHSRLKQIIAPMIPREADYDGVFDDVEYILGVAFWDATNRWAPVGRFRWRREDYRGRGARDGSLQRYRSELVAAGLFSGSEVRLVEVHAAYEQFLRGIHF